MDERGVEVEPFHAQSLGAQIGSAAGDAVLRAQAFGRIQLAIGRDLCEGQGRLEIPIQSGRQGRRHSGLPTDRQTGLQTRAFVFCARQ